MLFALVAHDRPHSVERRMELRPAHLKHLEELGDQVLLAGPFLDAQGTMVGSIVVIEADTEATAREMFARDPFMTGELFDSVTIKPWKLGINRLNK